MATKLLRREMDLTTGSVFKKLIVFAVPIILAYMLDKAFNMTNTIMLGILVNDRAVGAVGATGTIDTLLLNLFMAIHFLLIKPNFCYDLRVISCQLDIMYYYRCTNSYKRY